MFRTFALLAATTAFSTCVFALAPARPAAVSAQRPRIGIDPVADYVIPIVYDGGSSTTSFFLTNRDSKALHLAVYFVASNGMPLTLPIRDIGPTLGVTIDLDVNQSATFQTTGESVSFVDGYALVFTFDRSANDPAAKVTTDLFSGQATFMKNQNGVYVEALVPVSSGFETASAVSFDNTIGYSTAIILVNTDPNNATDVTLTIRDCGANLLQTDDIILAPGEKRFIPLASQYPSTAGQSGRVFLSGSGSFLTPIALRVNATGGLTTLLPWSIDNRLLP